MRDFDDATAVLASGVYVLRLRRRVVWVGRAKRVLEMLVTHTKRLPFGRTLEFDSVAVRRCRVDQLDEVWAATCSEVGWIRGTPEVVAMADRIVRRRA